MAQDENPDLILVKLWGGFNKLICVRKFYLEVKISYEISI